MITVKRGGATYTHTEKALTYNTAEVFTIKNGCVMVYDTSSYMSCRYYGTFIDGVQNDVITNAYITVSYNNGELSVTPVGPTYATTYNMEVFADDNTVIN